MHTGIISFCDRVAYNIKSSDTKDEILAELESMFQIKILQKHWHPLTRETVSQVYRAPHLACLRSNGNPYYMYFTTYEDVPIIYFIDKKVQPGYQKPRIIIGRGMFDESLFTSPTLIEGEMVKDTNGQWIFLVNDVIGYQGQYLRQVPLPKRLELAYKLVTQYDPDPVVDFCAIHVKQFCYATREGLDHLIELSTELPYTSRGLYYWPFIMQYKPKLYNFDETVIKEVHRKVKDNPEFRELREPCEPCELREPCVLRELREPPSPSPQPVPQQVNGESNITLWLRKTEHPDVYNVYESQNQPSPIGVSHVPSLAMSRKLHNIFKDITVTMSVAFTCKYNDKFKKYEPVALTI